MKKYKSSTPPVLLCSTTNTFYVSVYSCDDWLKRCLISCQELSLCLVLSQIHTASPCYQLLMIMMMINVFELLFIPFYYILTNLNFCSVNLQQTTMVCIYPNCPSIFGLNCPS